jgi:hypothetical protein
MGVGNSIAPNIFDVHADPQIIIPMVLGNLMSPLLWKLSEGIAAQQEQDGAGTEREQLNARLQALQRQVDRRFEHVSPARVAELNGVLDLDEESLRLGDVTVRSAVASIQATISWRTERGTLTTGDAITELIPQGRFPDYSYGNIDVLHASRRLLGKRSHPPLGITSCLDEVAIFAALAMTGPVDQLDGIVVLASPAHYTVFGWTGDESWWFYGKNALIRATDFQDLVAQQYAGDAQSAFDDRLPQIQHIVSRRGSHDLTTGVGSIPSDELDLIIAAMDRFFGVRLSQVGTDRSIVTTGHTALNDLLDECLPLRSAAAVQAHVFAAAAGIPDPMHDAAQSVLASFRSIHLADPSAYLEVARRSSLLRSVAVGITSIDEAIAIVAGIAGDESIFLDRDRLAMPDELLRLGTGTDRDKALALHALIEMASLVQRGELVTTFFADDSIVEGPGMRVSTVMMAQVGTRPGEPLVEIR